MSTWSHASTFPLHKATNDPLASGSGQSVWVISCLTLEHLTDTGGSCKPLPDSPGMTQPLHYLHKTATLLHTKRESLRYEIKSGCIGQTLFETGLHDNPWLCDCQISMLMSLSMSLGSPVVLMDQLLICSRAVGQSTILLTQAQFSHCMRPSVQPAATRVISPLGSNVILRCDATGYPTPTLTWIKTSAYTGRRPGLLLCL